MNVNVGDLVYGLSPHGGLVVDSQPVVKVTESFVYTRGYIYSTSFTRRIPLANVATSPAAAIDARLEATRAEIEGVKAVLHRLRTREGELVKMRASVSEPGGSAPAPHTLEGGDGRA